MKDFTSFKIRVEELAFETLNLMRNKSLEDFLELFIWKLSKEYEKTSIWYFLVLKLKVQEYSVSIKNHKKEDFCFPELFGLLEEKDVIIQGRQKDFTKYLRKVMLFLDSGKPVSKINDITGIRVIYNGKDNYDDAESIRECYNIMQILIRYFMSQKGFLVVEAEPLLFTEVLDENFKKKHKIYVPDKEEVLRNFPKEMSSNIKDYIASPKNNGYQSIHTILESVNTHWKLEIQVRTKWMHERAENGNADHAIHNNERYGDDWSHFFENDGGGIAGLNKSITF